MGRRATVVTEPVEEQAMACGGGRWAVAELGFGLSGGGGAPLAIEGVDRWWVAAWWCGEVVGEPPRRQTGSGGFAWRRTTMMRRVMRRGG
jgi:hypothetical protein